VKDANRIGLRKRTRATKINHCVKNAEASNERRNNLKGKAEQGDNMKELMITWCVGCGHLATAPAAGDLTCIRCLRGVINDNLNEIAQPVNYKGLLHD
jgi:hypothetical protein